MNNLCFVLSSDMLKFLKKQSLFFRLRCLYIINVLILLS